MKASTSELKQKLSKWQGELEKHLSLRIHALLGEIKSEDLSESQETSLFDLIIRIILRADEGLAQNMANLLIPINTDKPYSLEEGTISSSATFIRDYLKKDYICYVLKTKGEDKEEKESEPREDEVNYRKP